MSQISVAPATPVVVVGFDMPFWPLVRFLIKIAIASIPAGIVIAFFYMVLGWIYGALLIATHHTNVLAVNSVMSRCAGRKLSNLAQESSTGERIGYS